jgi:hypothetical protein
MSNNVNYIGKHKLNPSENYFFDANVWIFLFQPIGNSNTSLISQYASLFKELIKNECSIYISSHIISEFFNAVLRYEFNVLKRKNPTVYKDFKKDFKNTPIYNSLLNNLITITKTQILASSKPIGDDFDKINMDDLFNSIGMLDFNDKYYVELCATNNFTLVTDDKDFNSSPKPLNIITANNKLT